MFALNLFGHGNFHVTASTAHFFHKPGHEIDFMIKKIHQKEDGSN